MKQLLKAIKEVIWGFLRFMNMTTLTGVLQFIFVAFTTPIIAFLTIVYLPLSNFQKNTLAIIFTFVAIIWVLFWNRVFRKLNQWRDK